MAELGSLAQNVRKNHLGTARNTLVIIGALTLLLNGLVFFTAENTVDALIKKEVDKAGPGAIIDPAQVKEAKETMTKTLQLFSGGGAVLGLAFIILGLTVYLAPVPIVITGLVLYISAIAIEAVIDPTTLVKGWLIKMLVILLLGRAAQAAFAYQKEKVAEEDEDGKKDLDDLEVIS